MDWTERKVNLIYWWRNKGKDVCLNVAEPFGMLLVMVCSPLILIYMAFFDHEDEDREWCLRHGYPFDEWKTSHYEVKEWKKEYKAREKEQAKARIRREIEFKNFIKNGNTDN